MKKKTFLKSLSFTSLALLMGATGVFAFAPLGTSPSIAGASTVDQINTKADGENIKYAPSPLGLDPENDPVIYTTESGLEIKYGGESVSDKLPSGKPLSGYPYFTAGTYNGYAVNWVIIGRNTNDTVFTSAISSYLYSTWKTKNNISFSGVKPLAKYWFNGGGYETTTPAGSAINGVVPSKSYVADVTKATKTVVGNDEVPSGCVLAISELELGTCVFNNIVYRNSNLRTYCETLFTTTLQFNSAFKSSVVQPQDLKTTLRVGGSTASDTIVYDQHLFPLALAYDSSERYLGDQNFCIDNYLTTHDLMKLTTTYWLRTTVERQLNLIFTVPYNASDTNAASYAASNSVRPAMVVKL